MCFVVAHPCPEVHPTEVALRSRDTRSPRRIRPADVPLPSRGDHCNSARSDRASAAPGWQTSVALGSRHGRGAGYDAEGDR